MSDSNQNYRRGYVELVKLCTLMLNTIAADVKNGGTTIMAQSSDQLLSKEKVDCILEESRTLLHSISPSESFNLAEHDALFSRLMDLFSTLYGNDHHAWLCYQPEFEKRRKMQMN
ncbi:MULTISPECIES: hypothetical protein [Photorhabdus]|uniref:Uncharacterized protein n=2 Tax=Photorhabdus TaxID=29487 RepID=A0A7X5TLN1_9GAMM|nr:MULTISPECIES: hypothetical protein [Photorhabdus]MQL50071.1 hypothetical protein [Photorhabdus khanii]NHB98206.1 hypothetical protein [Photorhabdus stackebrandtii]